MNDVLTSEIAALESSQELLAEQVRVTEQQLSELKAELAERVRKVEEQNEITADQTLANDIRAHAVSLDLLEDAVERLGKRIDQQGTKLPPGESSQADPLSLLEKARTKLKPCERPSTFCDVPLNLFNRDEVEQMIWARDNNGEFFSWPSEAKA